MWLLGRVSSHVSPRGAAGSGDIARSRSPFKAIATVADVDIDVDVDVGARAFIS